LTPPEAQRKRQSPTRRVGVAEDSARERAGAVSGLDLSFFLDALQDGQELLRRNLGDGPCFGFKRVSTSQRCFFAVAGSSAA